MFPQPITQTDPDELFPCRDASQLTAKEQSGLNQSSRADADLAEDVDKALWNVPTLRSLDYNNIQIRVRNGMVGLYGHVASSTNRLEAEQAIRGLRGVVGIKDQLVMDDRLLAELSTGLGLLE